MTEESRLFAALLKYWRGRRGLSQLDLALTADVSARHISFLETGRSQPSREMVLLLASTLDVPLREQNAMLRAAGFDPAFEEPPLDALRDPAIERALDRMMAQHEPYPMVLMDRCYDVLRMNQGATRLFTTAVEAPPDRFNAVEALFDGSLLRPLVVNWEETARELVSRLHRESLHRPQDARLAALLEEILARPDVPDGWRRPDFSRGTSAAFAFRFRFHGQEFAFLTTLMTFSAPQNVTLDELQIESYFPLDDQTHRACLTLAGLPSD